jgi:hypothetical protein
VQAAGLVAATALLLVGVLLLDAAGLILDLVNTMACAVIDGYLRGRTVGDNDSR